MVLLVFGVARSPKTKNNNGFIVFSSRQSSKNQKTQWFYWFLEQSDLQKPKITMVLLVFRVGRAPKTKKHNGFIGFWSSQISKNQKTQWFYWFLEQPELQKPKITMVLLVFRLGRAPKTKNNNGFIGFSIRQSSKNQK